mmetsp:Transcript_66278/g.158554  ORF Transcript_66278/g.158554 Transcript_66278/m.158554 type:complete len:189 (-) Transcript_66278:39-605(-)
MSAVEHAYVLRLYRGADCHVPLGLTFQADRLSNRLIVTDIVPGTLVDDWLERNPHGPGIQILDCLIKVNGCQSDCEAMAAALLTEKDLTLHFLRFRKERCQTLDIPSTTSPVFVDAAQDSWSTVASGRQAPASPYTSRKCVLALAPVSSETGSDGEGESGQPTGSSDTEDWHRPMTSLRSALPCKLSL